MTDDEQGVRDPAGPAGETRHEASGDGGGVTSGNGRRPAANDPLSDDPAGAAPEAAGPGSPGAGHGRVSGSGASSLAPDSFAPDTTGHGLDRTDRAGGIEDAGDSRSAETGADDADDTDTGEPEDSAGEKKARKKPTSFWKELPILFVVALALAMIIKAFAVQAFYIPSQSMENTLKVGDRVLVNKIVYHTRDIKRGDVVVFNGLDSWDPEVQYSAPSNPFSKALHAVGSAFGIVPGEKDYIKRVIGVPGDHVKCCDAQGRVMVNGHPLNETAYIYTDPQTGEQNRPSDTKFDITVPAGHLWVMGDHREVSYDSRGHIGDPGGGTVPENRVIGRAFIIVWPLSRIHTLPIPKTFGQRGLALANAVTPPAPLTLGAVGVLPMAFRRRRRRRGRRPDSGSRRSGA